MKYNRLLGDIEVELEAKTTRQEHHARDEGGPQHSMYSGEQVGVGPPGENENRSDAPGSDETDTDHEMARALQRMYQHKRRRNEQGGDGGRKYGEQRHGRGEQNELLEQG